MKEKRTLLQKLAARLKKSATKVNPKAKKGFKAALKGRGFSKKEIKAATKKASATAKAAAKAVKTAKTPKSAPEKEPVKVAGISVDVAKVQKLAKIGGQLRPTPRTKKGF